MRSVEQARAEVLAAVRPLEAQDVPLGLGALDRTLAEDVRAQGDVPPWANSAMDGIALRAADSGPGARLRLTGESRAGTPSPVAVQPGTAVRISTGAVLPPGADAVEMVERLREHPDGTVELERAVAPGAAVRAAGTDVRAGAVVVPAGTALHPAALGAAVNAGVASVRCHRRPRVVVLATGDELRPPGAPLGPGQIHDSNAPALAALAQRAGAEVLRTAEVPDTREATRAAIGEALAQADVLVLSGGVSVGPHDHVKPALEAEGVREVFWRVALRPGKPTWFGLGPADTPQLVFGLPGNPVSAMVTFLLFARPALRALQGADPGARRVEATLTEPVARTEGRDELVRVVLDDAGGARPTGPQGSHVLTSMLLADGLARLPAGPGELPAGTRVEVELLER